MINIFMFAINLSFYSFLNLKATTNSVEKKWEYKTKQNKKTQHPLPHLTKKQTKTKYKWHFLSLSRYECRHFIFFAMCGKINLENCQDLAMR